MATESRGIFQSAFIRREKGLEYARVVRRLGAHERALNKTKQEVVSIVGRVVPLLGRCIW